VIRRLAWVTTRDAHGKDADEPLALAGLAEAGVQVEVVEWDDGRVDWSTYDRAVLRSTWDYAERLPEFLEWLERVAGQTELRNPLQMVRWSLDKHYLAEFATAGVPVPPSTFFEPGELPVLPTGGLVVKPAVGAGSRDAGAYGPEQAELAHAHTTRLLERGVSVLVQPLLASVAVEGEWPLVFFDGAYSHAASKRVALPRGRAFDGFFAPEQNSPYVADHQQVDVAQAAVDLVAARFGIPTYARVDLVRDDSGAPCVLEVELVEPSLFLPEAGPETLSRLVAALTAP